MVRAIAVVIVEATVFMGAGADVQAQPPACPWIAPSQFLADRPSPPDSTVIVLGGEPVKVCYSRPSARGRTVFGGLVRYDRVWRTGANEPTILLLPVKAEVAGVIVEPGAYVLLTIPGEEEWTVLLNTTEATTPAEMFASLTEVGRGTVQVEVVDEHIETFTIRGTADSLGGELILEWERVRVRIPITSTK